MPLQAASTVGAFQHALPRGTVNWDHVPSHNLGPSGSMPTSCVRPDPRQHRLLSNPGAVPPVRQFQSGPPFVNGAIHHGGPAPAHHLGNFGVPSPETASPVGLAPVNTFVKAQSSEFGVNEITSVAAKRSRTQTGI